MDETTWGLFQIYLSNLMKVRHLEKPDINKLLELSTLAYEISNSIAKDKRLDFIRKAYEHCKEAYNLDSSRLEVLRLLCSTTGRLAEESYFYDKILFGAEFKKYLDKAIEMDDEQDPNTTFELRHMRGRFAYTASNLGFFTKIIAQILGIVPSMSLDDIICDFLKADTVVPQIVENELFLGKTFLAQQNFDNARIWLEKAASREADSEIESEYIQEAQTLLNSF